MPARLPILIAAGLSAACLTACGETRDDGAAEAGTPAPGGFEALTADEIRGAALDGELGCGFFADAEFPVLSAMGRVAMDDPSDGIVKRDGSVIGLSAPGGFDAMLGGVAFEGEDGAVYRVEVTGPAEGGGESPPRPATLATDDGDSETLEGRWQCGP